MVDRLEELLGVYRLLASQVSAVKFSSSSPDPEKLKFFMTSAE